MKHPLLNIAGGLLFLAIGLSGSLSGHAQTKTQPNKHKISRKNAVPIKDWKLVKDSGSARKIATPRLPEHAFDDNPKTHWHSNWDHDHPHHLIIDMGQEYTVEAFRLLPRQDGSGPGDIKRCGPGDIKRCALYRSNDPEQFVLPAVITELPKTKRAVEIPFKPQTGRYFMIRTFSEHAGAHRAAIAEIVLVRKK